MALQRSAQHGLRWAQWESGRPDSQCALRPCRVRPTQCAGGANQRPRFLRGGGAGRGPGLLALCPDSLRSSSCTWPTSRETCCSASRFCSSSWCTRACASSRAAASAASCSFSRCTCGGRGDGVRRPSAGRPAGGAVSLDQKQGVAKGPGQAAGDAREGAASSADSRARPRVGPASERSHVHECSRGGPGTCGESVQREALLRAELKLVRRRPHLLPRSVERDPGRREQGGAMPGVGGSPAVSALETAQGHFPREALALLVLRDGAGGQPEPEATRSKRRMVKTAAEQTEPLPF